jgi:hypothetical protein
MTDQQKAEKAHVEKVQILLTTLKKESDMQGIYKIKNSNADFTYNYIDHDDGEWS